MRIQMCGRELPTLREMVTVGFADGQVAAVPPMNGNMLLEAVGVASLTPCPEVATANVGFVPAVSRPRVVTAAQ